MDTNLKLIRTVKQNPVLYRKNVSLVDRREGWKQLAEQFDMPEQNIKSRWHFLVQNFLHNKTCTYKKEMSFMIPHLSAKPNITKITTPNESSNIINPEFYITEKDIENPSDNEDYVFLEVEQLDENGDEVIVEEAITTNNYMEEVEVKTHKINNLDKKSLQQKSPEKPKQNIKTEDEQKPKQERAEKEQCSNDEIIIPDIVTVNTPSNNNNQSNEETTKVETDKSADSEDEDMIFCKLVMAMMQKMDSEKKFKVKKDIMQILFS